MTETTTRALQPGDQLHVLAGGLLLFGEALKRGDVLTLRADHFERSRNRDGVSWLDDLSEAAQRTRWGSVKLGLGPWPEALPTWLEHGDPTWQEQYQRARAEAYRQPTAEQRDAALREVQRAYGGPPTTSRTLSAPASSPQQRAAEEQRARLDAQGLQVRNSYSPQRREV